MLTIRQASMAEARRARLQVLLRKLHERVATPAEEEEFAALDKRLRQAPKSVAQFMPTKLGNIMRSAEAHPRDFYGLDNSVCWPRLWLVLSPEVKGEVSRARASLDTAAQVWLWGMLFLIWTAWTFWAAPIGLTISMLGYQWMLRAANVYSDLTRAVHDLFRRRLYEAVEWPVPKNPAEEYKAGAALSVYLLRGFAPNELEFERRT